MTDPQDSNSDYAVIESLSSMLTPAQVFKFLEKSVPELEQGQGEIKQALENQEWEVAAEQAHRLKSTIGLLSVDSLVVSLDLIEAGDTAVIQSPEFRGSFVTECQQLIDSLESYLAN